MKRFLIVVLMLVFSISMLYAGGRQEAELDGPVTLDMWFQDWTAGLEITREFADHINRVNPDININIIPIPRESMTERTIPAIMTGTEPDIIFGYTSYLEGIDYSRLFYPITPNFFSKEDAEEYWYENFLSIMEGSDGNYYGIPWGSGSDGWGFVMNNELADKAGIEYTPGVHEFADWDELVAAAEAMTEYNPDGSIRVSGISMGTEVVPIFETFALSLGARPFDNETGTWDFNTDPCRQALDLLYTDLVVERKVFDPQFEDTYSAFPRGIVGLGCLGPWSLGAFSADYPELDMTYVPLPVPSDDPKYSMVAWAFFFFSQDLSGPKEEAARFVAQELATQVYPLIQIEKWAGTPANKAFVDGIMAGEIEPETEIGKVNARIAARMAEAFAPNIYLFEGTEVTTEQRSLIISTELSSLFSGMQDIDTTLRQITTRMNRAEQN